MKLLLLLIGIIISGQTIFASTLTYSIEGNQLKSISLEKLKQRLKVVEVPKYYKGELQKQTYNGFDFSILLTELYGPKWKDYKEVVFHTKNKYRPSIKTALFKPEYSFLTFEVTGQKSFYQFDKNSNMLVNLGPFYLVWNIKKSGDNSFVYQVEQIDLIKSGGKLPLVNTGNKNIDAGREYFQKFCIRCHSLNGKGGTFGKDLANPNIVKSKTSKFVIKYILNPKDIKAFSKMPALKKSLDDKDGIAKSIALYIESLK